MKHSFAVASIAASSLANLAFAQEAWWGDNLQHPCDPALGLTATGVVAIAGAAPGGVGYVATSGQLGIINLAKFSTSGSYLGSAHYSAPGTFQPVGIEAMSNGDYLVTSRYTFPSGSTGAAIVRIDPAAGVANHVICLGDVSGRLVAHEMSDGSVTASFRRACSASNGDAPVLVNLLLPHSGSVSIVWSQGYQGAAGEQFYIQDFREKTGSPNTVVFVGYTVPPSSFGGVACIGEANAATGAPIGSLHTYDNGVVGGASFDRIEITPTGWHVVGLESLISFPNFTYRTRITKFSNTSTRLWERMYAMGLSATGIASRGGSSPALFVGGSHPGGNLGYLALFSPGNGAFGGCQTFNSAGVESFDGMVLDYTSPIPLPVLAGRFNGAANGTGTNYGYFVRTAANGSTPCSLPVIPNELPIASVRGSVALVIAPAPTNGTLPCTVVPFTTAASPFQTESTACFIIGGGTGPVWWRQICGPCPQQCSIADMGGQGGAAMFCGDGLLNNNDFVVFIDEFFAGTARADVGSQGGEYGSDGLYNNDDFVVFVDAFFTGC